jgi:hypothetical protein
MTTVRWSDLLYLYSGNLSAGDKVWIADVELIPVK